MSLKEAKSHVRMLDIDVNKELNIPDIYEKIIRTGTLSEGSCFFHSVLKGLNLDGYSKMDEQNKLEYMIELRNKLSDSLTIDQYKNNLMNISSMRLSIELRKFLNELYNFIENPIPYLQDKCKNSNFLGEILEDNVKVFKIINSVLSINQFENVIDNPKINSSLNIDIYIKNFGVVLYDLFVKEIEEIGANVTEDKLSICQIQIYKFTKNISNFIINNQFQKYKKEIKKTNEWASDVMFGLLADYLNIDIYFININSKKVLPYDHVSKGDRPSVVVGWINENHFENISINESAGITRLFQPNHPFILSIKEKINKEKRQPLELKEDKKDKDSIKTIYSYNSFNKDKENPEDILLIIKKDPYYPSNKNPEYFKLTKSIPYYQSSDIFIKKTGDLPSDTIIYYTLKYPGYKQNWAHPTDKNRIFDVIYIYRNNNWHTEIMLEKGWKDYIEKPVEKQKSVRKKEVLDDLDFGTWAEEKSDDINFNLLSIPVFLPDISLPDIKMKYKKNNIEDKKMEEKNMLNDVFRNEISWNGYRLDIMKSGLQKYIRRGNFEKALYCAGELDLFKEAPNRGETIRTNFIHRLMIIYMEDVENLSIFNYVYSLISKLFLERESLKRNKGLEEDTISHLVYILTKSEKARICSHVRAIFNPIYNKPELLNKYPSIKKLWDEININNSKTLESHCLFFKKYLKEKNIICLYYAFQIDLSEEKLKQKYFKSDKAVWFIFKELLSLSKNKERIERFIDWYKNHLKNVKESYLCWLFPLLHYIDVIPEGTPVDMTEINKYSISWNNNRSMKKIEIDDYVIDKHTQKGQEKGLVEFAICGALVKNEAPFINKLWKKFYEDGKRLEERVEILGEFSEEKSCESIESQESIKSSEESDIESDKSSEESDIESDKSSEESDIESQESEVKEREDLKSIKAIKTVPGLFYIDNAISKNYSKQLYKDINSKEWASVSKSLNSRKVQHYGYKYDYKRRAVAEKGPPIPSFLHQLIQDLKDYIKKLNLKDLEFNQVIINKYEPGQGISKHTDAKDYGPIIGCYTIESGSTMKFHKDDNSVGLYVNPNSLYIMSGESRYKWTHEMPSTKSDLVDGKRLPRSCRISITFRNVPVKDGSESDSDSSQSEETLLSDSSDSSEDEEIVKKKPKNERNDPLKYPLETDEYKFIVLTQLVTSSSKMDVYFAKDGEGNLVVVKGPYQDKKQVDIIIKNTECKKQNNLPYIPFIVRQLIPDRWSEGIPLGIRNRIDRRNPAWFIIFKSVIEENKIKKKIHSSKLWPETEVVDWDKISSIHFEYKSGKRTDKEIKDYVHAILFRYMRGISDLADRNFLMVSDDSSEKRIISIDEDIEDHDVKIVTELRKNKAEYIYKWLRKNYDKLDVDKWTLCDKKDKKRLEVIQNKETCLKLFQ
jgi:alkylated DNA repair dioxygenase AlkB